MPTASITTGLAEPRKSSSISLADLADAREVPAFRDAVAPRIAADGVLAGAAGGAAGAAVWNSVPGRAGRPAEDRSDWHHAGLAGGKVGAESGRSTAGISGPADRRREPFRLELLAARGETTFLVERAGSSIPQLLKVTPTRRADPRGHHVADATKASRHGAPDAGRLWLRGPPGRAESPRPDLCRRRPAVQDARGVLDAAHDGRQVRWRCASNASGKVRNVDAQRRG